MWSPAVQPRPRIVIPTTGKTNRAKLAARHRRAAAAEHDQAASISLVRDDSAEAIGLEAPELDFGLARQLASALKRCIDIIGAAVGLLLLSPIFALVAIAIKVESPGPMFFAHSRLGRGGRLFSCWKFRSMHEDAESRLHADEVLRHHYVSNHFKIPHHLDPRITRLGRFLRKSSLDEIPQLWNVLSGDMSLVGPRPIVPLESSHYGDDASVLLSMRPGLTGAWAVYGRNRVGYPMRANVELEYVKNWTLATDLAILARTPHAVFTQSGVY
jgi:exopolysaccharide production protein ExoY